MTHRAREAALRILLLKEEFSSSELKEAVTLLATSEPNEVIAYLAGSTADRTKSQRKAGRQTETADRGESRILEALKAKEPEKHRVLATFERDLREGTLLPTMDDLRRLFDQLGAKRIETGKSRKEAIRHLLRHLAEMDVPTINNAIERARSLRIEHEGAYRRLADHIMSAAAENEKGPHSR